jgi:hypothetical protein
LLADEPADRTTPLLVIFMTDGGFAPSKDIARIITNAAHKPIFWQFVGIGNSNFGMLRNLDTLPNRVVDNAGFFAVNDLAKISDEELYDRLLSEFPAWLKAARARASCGHAERIPFISFGTSDAYLVQSRLFAGAHRQGDDGGRHRA